MLIDKQHLNIIEQNYDQLFLVEDRNFWTNCEPYCNKNTDLVLCIDFALKQYLTDKGYHVCFLDHIVDRRVMHSYNFEMHTFMDNWFKAAGGEDLSLYKGFSIGDALLLNVHNDITYFCHFFFNLLAIKSISYNKLQIGTNELLIPNILNKLKIAFEVIDKNPSASFPVYVFPISAWMDEKINQRSLKTKVKETIASTLDKTLAVFDKIFKSNKKRIVIQGYYPTYNIINELKKDKDITLVLSAYSGIRNLASERRILFSNTRVQQNSINEILQKLDNAKKFEWAVQDHPLSEYLYQLIKPILVANIQSAISQINSIQHYFNNNPIKLMVPVTNFWLTNRLVMNYCKNNNIPIYMVINGLLTVDFPSDARDSDWVNCYSEAIKQQYFKNSDNVVCLGDPRMDNYIHYPLKTPNREYPTIIIGAAGFDPTDLNSYLAYEFDFLYDILNAISLLNAEGKRSKVILKVRANGYSNQYQTFVKEYFPDTSVRIEQVIPFKEVIKEADLYISFYSQSIYEASCIGVPTLYYKKDTQIVHAPFNGESELTTAFNTEDMKNKIAAFYNNDPCFDTFLNKNVMEKYIGKLDGRNTERNVSFIYSLIQASPPEN